MLHAPKTWWDVLQLFRFDLLNTRSEKQANEIFNLTYTALSRYASCGLGQASPKSRKPTQAEKAAAEELLKSLSIKRLEELPDLLQKAFTQLGSNPSQIYTYRSKGLNLLAWARNQAWYPLQATGKSKEKRSPSRGHGFTPSNRKKLTKRKRKEPYSLADGVSQELDTALACYYDYLISVEYPKRLHKPVSQGTASNYVKAIRALAGWIFYYSEPLRDGRGKLIGYKFLKSRNEKPFLKSLGFNQIIPGIASEYSDTEAAILLEYCLTGYFNFLTARQCQGITTFMMPLLALQKLFFFQYAGLSLSLKDYKIHQVHEILERHLSKRRGNKEDRRRRVADEDLKWLEYPEIITKIIKPLQQECRFRSALGNKRSIKAIAHSFQIFLMWCFIVLSPPRRQQEYRGLKFSIMCPKDRPKDLPPNQVYHPLPESDERYDEHNIKFGYLYKSTDGCWYKHMPEKSYKTGKTYKEQTLLIHNSRLDDGKYLYDYLEAFLYGYYQNSNGDWISGGQVDPTCDYLKALPSLRVALEPLNHNHLFSKPKAKKPYKDQDYCTVFQNAAYRLSGQQLSPHFIREVVATWFLDEGYLEIFRHHNLSDQISEYSYLRIIESLAFLMATSERTLREIYDRRTAKKLERAADTIFRLVVGTYFNDAEPA